MRMYLNLYTYIRKCCGDKISSGWENIRFEAAAASAAASAAAAASVAVHASALSDVCYAT